MKNFLLYLRSFQLIKQQIIFHSPPSLDAIRLWLLQLSGFSLEQTAIQKEMYILVLCCSYFGLHECTTSARPKQYLSSIYQNHMHHYVSLFGIIAWFMRKAGDILKQMMLYYHVSMWIWLSSFIYKSQYTNLYAASMCPLLNSLLLGDDLCRHKSWSTLAQLIACCLTAPSHYPNQCWLIKRVLWHSWKSNFPKSAHEFDP